MIGDQDEPAREVAEAAVPAVGRRQRAGEGFAVEEVEEEERAVGSGEEKARGIEGERGRRDGLLGEGAPRGADQAEAVAVGRAEEGPDLVQQLRREVGPARRAGAGGGV